MVDVRKVLEDVHDPEIPALSITDLGIVRDVHYDADGSVEVVLTPTYSGCPATQVIRDDVERALRAHGVKSLRVTTRLSPAWTTGWITERGRRRLKEAGIAPPHQCHPELVEGPILVDRSTSCPLCGAKNIAEISRFGSTPCKALYRCVSCGEPFEYFKSH
jgi:ring-1,2-phenylacetyl-CoA epoxidase subunit PaaD